MTDQVITLCLMAIASGTLALVLTASQITRPLRHQFIDAPYMLGELINCPYCMAFWTGLPLNKGFWVSYSGLNSIVSYFAIVGLSHLFIGIVLRLFLFRESENEELREMLRESRETINDLLEEQNGKAKD